jgi:tetratricopeptide (TPR) repeat protein
MPTILVAPTVGGHRQGSLFCLAACLVISLFSACATTPTARLAQEWYDIGNAWYDQGKWEKAGTAYSRAIALDPGLSAASYNLSRALAESGNYTGALAAIDAVLASDRLNVKALSSRAYILYKSGNFKAAAGAYDQVLALAPDAPDARFNAALIKVGAKDYEGALAELAPLITASTDDVNVRILNARALAGSGKREEAINAFEKLSGASGKLTSSDFVTLAGLYVASRDYAKAIDAYAAATASDPKNADAWFALARLRLVEAEDGKAGLEALGKALGAGFADKKAAADLLAEPILAEREAATKALHDKGLIP